MRVYCNIHPQMSAFVLVRDNPFWARPAADGSFAIEGVPAGQLDAEGLARARRRGAAAGRRWPTERRGRGARSRSTRRASSARRTRTSSARTTRRARRTERGGRDGADRRRSCCSSAALVVAARGRHARVHDRAGGPPGAGHDRAGPRRDARGLAGAAGRPLQQAPARRARARERPAFKAALVETDQATAFDTMRERGRDLAADFMLATDPAGALVARTDRPGGRAATTCSTTRSCGARSRARSRRRSGGRATGCSPRSRCR